MPSQSPPATPASTGAPTAAADPATTADAIVAPATGPDGTAVPPAMARLLKLVGGPRDNALLHHAIGIEWLKLGQPVRAAAALRTATGRDAGFSAAWKLLGKALVDCGDATGAGEAWQHGIAAAEARGDVQAAKEMRVFLRRIQREEPKT